jgi:ATP-dependent HslUV protease ATP-binding subunit HslU
METAVKQMREQATSKVQFRAEEAAEERVLNTLLPPPRSVGFGEAEPQREEGAARQRFRKKLREGTTRKSKSSAAVSPTMEIFTPPGMEDLSQQLQGMFQNLGQSQFQLQSRLPADLGPISSSVEQIDGIDQGWQGECL